MTDLWPRLEALLAHVERPARYVNHEWGSVRKEDADFSFCMVYPDTYELGQANQAVRILANAVNATGHLRAERAFLPAADLIDRMREAGLPLFSIESCAPLREFDAIGITLPHELAATNVLETLDLAGIPLHAGERREEDPFVLGGGPCAFKPEPYAPFFDAVSLGRARRRFPRRCWCCASSAPAARRAPRPCARWRGLPAATCPRSTAGAARRRRSAPARGWSRWSLVCPRA